MSIEVTPGLVPQQPAAPSAELAMQSVELQQTDLPDLFVPESWHIQDSAVEGINARVLEEQTLDGDVAQARLVPIPETVSNRSMIAYKIIHGVAVEDELPAEAVLRVEKIRTEVAERRIDAWRDSVRNPQQVEEAIVAEAPAEVQHTTSAIAESAPESEAVVGSTKTLDTVHAPAAVIAEATRPNALQQAGEKIRAVTEQAARIGSIALETLVVKPAQAVRTLLRRKPARTYMDPSVISPTQVETIAYETPTEVAESVADALTEDAPEQAHKVVQGEVITDQNPSQPERTQVPIYTERPIRHASRRDTGPSVSRIAGKAAKNTILAGVAAVGTPLLGAAIGLFGLGVAGAEGGGAIALGVATHALDGQKTHAETRAIDTDRAFAEPRLADPEVCLTMLGNVNTLARISASQEMVTNTAPKTVHSAWEDIHGVRSHGQVSGDVDPAIVKTYTANASDGTGTRVVKTVQASTKDGSTGQVFVYQTVSPTNTVTSQSAVVCAAVPGGDGLSTVQVSQTSDDTVGTLIKDLAGISLKPVSSSTSN